MIDLSDQDLAVLDRYSKAVVHLRDAYRRGTFTIGFGIDFTNPLGIPDWDLLFDRVAANPRVGANNADRPLASPSQRAMLLFDHFTEESSVAFQRENEDTIATMQTEGEWFEILRNCLYQDIPQTQTLDQCHPYLRSWLPLLRETSLVTNYGIDNGLQMMLGDHVKRRGNGDRFWETVYNANLPFSDRVTSIYHPYGYLPENSLEGFSDTIAYPKDAPAAYLRNSPGQESMLRYLFSKQTALLIGVSLEDNPLVRYHLQQNAQLNPGHIHYYIRQSPESDSSGGQKPPDERFETFNLVTLTLDEDECRSLARLIRCDNNTFHRSADRRNVRVKWIYYITGPPGVGKTSVVNHFRGFTACPEWSSEPPEVLKLPFTELEPGQEDAIDRWVAKQYAKRNSRLAEENEGIFIVDRAPLDPILFTEDNKTAAKATWYRDRLDEHQSHSQLVPGLVLLLTGDPKVIAGRVARRQAAADPEYLAMLKERYNRVYDLSRTIEIHTEEKALRDVVGVVSEQIHRQDYVSAPLHVRLSELEEDDEG